MTDTHDEPKQDEPTTVIVVLPDHDTATKVDPLFLTTPIIVPLTTRGAE